MSGALARSTRRRQRFADGGGTGATDDQWFPGGATGPGSDVMPVPIPVGALGASQAQQPAGDGAAADQIGAYVRSQTGGGPQEQQKLTDIQRAMAVLQAGRGSTNLPMLAAAGALLSPTRTGSFAENLGNAFQAAVPVAEAQRKLEEEAQLRLQQMEMNQEWRRQMAGIQQERVGYYGQRVQSMGVRDAAIAAWHNMQAAAGPHETVGDVMNSTVEATVRSLVGKTNPDTGQPWTEDEARQRAFQEVKNFDVARQRADTQLGTAMENLRHHQATEQTAQERADAAKQQAEQTRQYRQEALRQTKDIAARREIQIAADADIRAAASMVNSPNNLGANKLTFADALAKVRGEREKLTPAPAEGATAGGGATAGTFNSPVKVQTTDEAAKLPPGTFFLVPGETVPRMRSGQQAQQ